MRDGLNEQLSPEFPVIQFRDDKKGLFKNKLQIDNYLTASVMTKEARSGLNRIQ